MIELSSRGQSCAVVEHPPSFLIGSGRCGSTALYRALAMHPRVSWVSALLDRFPARPELNAIAGHGMHLPGARQAVLRYARPSEAYRWWDVSFPGFQQSRRDLEARDVTPVVAERVRTRAADLVAPARPNLLFKITGWPRMGFLQEIFPEARFVHVVRDGRAVASSMLHVPWWDGWLGPSAWRYGPLSESQEGRWRASDRSYVVLAGLAWEILMDAFDEALADLDGDRVLTVRYEDLCAEPDHVMRTVTDFLELEWTDGFRRIPWSSQFKQSDAWRTSLTPSQLDELGACLDKSLERFGYR